MVHAANVGAHHGQAAGHGFQHHNRLAFVEAGQDEGVVIVDDFAHLHCAAEDHAVAHTDFLCVGHAAAVVLGNVVGGTQHVNSEVGVSHAHEVRDRINKFNDAFNGHHAGDAGETPILLPTTDDVVQCFTTAEAPIGKIVPLHAVRQHLGFARNTTQGLCLCDGQGIEVGDVVG